MVYVMRMGRWSELREVIVFHEILFAISVVAVVMSGDEGCWSVCGFLVCVFVLSVVCGELSIRSEIRCPLWSSVCECHVVECAFTSPIVIDVPSVSMWAKVFVMSVSSVLWSGSVVSRGGMYMLVR